MINFYVDPIYYGQKSKSVDLMKLQGPPEMSLAFPNKEQFIGKIFNNVTEEILKLDSLFFSADFLHPNSNRSLTKENIKCSLSYYLNELKSIEVNDSNSIDFQFNTSLVLIKITKLLILPFSDELSDKCNFLHPKITKDFTKVDIINKDNFYECFQNIFGQNAELFYDLISNIVNQCRWLWQYVKIGSTIDYSCKIFGSLSFDQQGNINSTDHLVFSSLSDSNDLTEGFLKKFVIEGTFLNSEFDKFSKLTWKLLCRSIFYNKKLDVKCDFNTLLNSLKLPSIETETLGTHELKKFRENWNTQEANIYLVMLVSYWLSLYQHAQIYTGNEINGRWISMYEASKNLEIQGHTEPSSTTKMTNLFKKIFSDKENDNESKKRFLLARDFEFRGRFLDEVTAEAIDSIEKNREYLQLVALNSLFNAEITKIDGENVHVQFASYLTEVVSKSEFSDIILGSKVEMKSKNYWKHLKYPSLFFTEDMIEPFKIDLISIIDNLLLKNAFPLTDADKQEDFKMWWHNDTIVSEVKQKIENLNGDKILQIFRWLPAGLLPSENRWTPLYVEEKKVLCRHADNDLFFLQHYSSQEIDNLLKLNDYDKINDCLKSKDENGNPSPKWPTMTPEGYTISKVIFGLVYQPGKDETCIMRDKAANLIAASNLFYMCCANLFNEGKAHLRNMFENETTGPLLRIADEKKPIDDCKDSPTLNGTILVNYKLIQILKPILFSHLITCMVEKPENFTVMRALNPTYHQLGTYVSNKPMDGFKHLGEPFMMAVEGMTGVQLRKNEKLHLACTRFNTRAREGTLSDYPELELCVKDNSNLHQQNSLLNSVINRIYYGDEIRVSDLMRLGITIIVKDGNFTIDRNNPILMKRSYWEQILLAAAKVKDLLDSKGSLRENISNCIEKLNSEIDTEKRQKFNQKKITKLEADIGRLQKLKNVSNRILVHDLLFNLEKSDIIYGPFRKIPDSDSPLGTNRKQLPITPKRRHSASSTPNDSDSSSKLLTPILSYRSGTPSPLFDNMETSELNESRSLFNDLPPEDCEIKQNTKRKIGDYLKCENWEEVSKLCLQMKEFERLLKLEKSHETNKEYSECSKIRSMIRDMFGTSYDKSEQINSLQNEIDKAAFNKNYVKAAELQEKLNKLI
tara:strand:+ start:395 stop:3814 length:3420 start_codon:yes stop_codon:yes gene_type:complete